MAVQYSSKRDVNLDKSATTEKKKKNLPATLSCLAHIPCIFQPPYLPKIPDACLDLKSPASLTSHRLIALPFFKTDLCSL